MKERSSGKPDRQWLLQQSLNIILAHQAPSGAFIASPNFPTYAFSWFRDSSYIAYALDVYGQFGASERFHDWAANSILRHEDVVGRALQKALAGEHPGEDVLHTRYTLDGEENTGTAWENFQLDGFGTWLWALNEHVRLSGKPAKSEWLRAANLTADYLAGLWRFPCYDCWEEFGDKIHPHTLAAIYGGLSACEALTGDSRLGYRQAIKEFLLEHGQADGRWQKFIGNSQVDASLLALSTPYRVVSANDPVMLCTAQKIEQDLCPGGVRRYATDTYFGGGQWLLLAAWLGWYWCEAGKPEKASDLRDWVEAQVNEQGWMPEQVPAQLIDESMYAPWVQRWGPIANPLLWSHAEYLILCRVLDAGK